MAGTIGKRRLRLAGRVGKWAGILLLVLIAAAFVAQRIGLRRDEKLRPPKAEFVSVDGRPMHVSCVGQGPRTFVLDAGAGAWSVFWWRVQPALARAGRVCVFDRAGYGWSDPTEGGHDAAAAAERLHAMVRAAGIGRPFVYVGHSLGANIGQVYRSRYPGDVAALVLIEPGDPKDLLEDFHGSRAEAMAAKECGLSCAAGAAAGQLGVLRPLARGKSFGPVAAQYRAGINRPSFLPTVLSELGAVPKTAYQTLDVKGFGDTPVLVFASSDTRRPEGKETPADVARWQVGQRAYLASLSGRSTRGGGLVVVPGSTHLTMVLGEAQADFLSRRILEFVTASEDVAAPSGS